MLSEFLADSSEEPAALSPLRSADADAFATANFMLLVEKVEHVGSDRNSVQHARLREVLRQGGVEHEIARCGGGLLRSCLAAQPKMSSE